MKLLVKIGILSLILVPITLGFAQERYVSLAKVDGVIGPISARFMIESIQAATRGGAECLLIELDTPGGLDESMRLVIKEIMASDIPVIVYVSPSGSRAASAGAFITMAAHIAAMAPGTNIGAAHPVQLGGEKIDKELSEKIANDAAAYLKAIAEKRGRNVKWAEEAVRKSSSITEKEALKTNVIDLIAPNVRDLLDSLDGKKVNLNSTVKTLKTKGVTLRRVEMGLRYRILSTLTNPNIAYVLFMLGILGLYFELSNPGAILPGVIGGICLILAFFAFQTLSINYAGLLLIIFAIILFIADIKAPTHGVLTVGGIVSMTLGSLMLFNAPEPFLRLSWAVIIPTVLITASFFAFAVGMGLMAQKRRATTGMRGLIGEIGLVKVKIEEEGRIFLHGELWRAVSEEVIEEGEKVKVIGIDGLTLKVVKV